MSNVVRLLEDVVALLKEQEGARPKMEKDESGVSWYVCGSCKAQVSTDFKYCYECGAELKWDD